MQCRWLQDQLWKVKVQVQVCSFYIFLCAPSTCPSVPARRPKAPIRARQVVVSEYKWLQAYVQPLQCMTLFWWRILWHFFKQRWKLCDALSGDSKKWKKCLWLSVRVPLSFTPNAMWQSIVWQPLHSVSSPNHCTLWNKKIKPCDNNLKSAKVYRALDEGILVCFRHESGDGEEDHPTRRWVVWLCVFFDHIFCYISTFVHCKFNARFFH